MGKHAQESYVSGEIDALNTDEIEEGLVNLYFTDSRAISASEAVIASASAAALSAANSYSDSLDTDDINEGSLNLYFTSQRVIDSASATFLSQSDAASSYATKSSPTFSGTVTVPTPVNATDASTKQYVDETAEGLRVKPAVEIATTENLTATYDNGSSGVGATLTATSNGAFPEIDGVTLTSTTLGENGVLVKNQTNAAHNGRYNLTQVGDASNPWILTKCGLCDQSNEIPGMYIFVKRGTFGTGTGWVATVSNPSTYTVGTDNVSYIQFSGAGTYTAGSGLTLTGTQFSVTDDGHNHIISNVDGLQTELDLKAPLSSPSITGGSISGATSITLSGSQTLASYRARNIYISTTDPGSGNDGDIWLKY
jgi:hypothetical protein